MRSRVDALLSQAPKGTKKATSFKVEAVLYDRFQEVCKSRGITTSELLEAMLEELLARVEQSAPVPQKRGRPVSKTN